jgi:hypothetical protein
MGDACIMPRGISRHRDDVNAIEVAANGLREEKKRASE